MNEKMACPRCGETNLLWHYEKGFMCPKCGWTTRSNDIFEGIPKSASACGKCLNNPENGGSGICNCILGMQTLYY